MKNRKIFIIVGACMNNRGSEALIRGTIEVINRKCHNCEISLSSAEPNFSNKIALPYVSKYINRAIERHSLTLNLLYRIAMKFFIFKKLIGSIRYYMLVREARQSDLVIVVGADNYCYGVNRNMFILNSTLRGVSNKMMMFDCSLKQSAITDLIRKDILLFDMVTVRDQNTFSGFSKIFTSIPIYYHPDPAFVMPISKCKLPMNFKEKNTIGINLSTMVLQSHYCTNKDLVIANFKELINWILNNTQSNVILVPHVMQRKDLDSLEILYTFFNDNNRIILLNDETLNASELKYLISKCRMFVGARTHATIASYSSCVPTLVLGYSEKSIGIAQDLFGTDKDYVLQVQELQTEYDLSLAFERLYHKESEIRTHLEKIIPGYIERVWEVGSIINNLIQKES